MTKAKNNSLYRLIFIFICALSVFLLFSCGTAYAKEVEITDEYGYSYTLTVPDKPQYVTPKKVSSSTIRIEWLPANYWTENGFEVCTYNPSTKNYTHVAYTSKTAYTLKNLKQNTKYTIAVREYIVCNGKKYFSDYSDKLTAQTSPKTPTLSKASYKSKGKINMKWKKVSGVKGYIVQYSTSKSFAEKNTCTVIVSGESKKEKTISKLFAKKYYVRVCSYQTVSKRKYCSEWSKIKTVNVKKGVSLKEAINSTKTDLSGRDAIKQYTNKGVDIKKYQTTYDRMKAIFNWHAKHYKDFANCVECNASFASCVNELYGSKKQYDDFIWLAADNFKNSNGSVVMHKWCVLYINGVQYIFDPRLQGYTGNYTGNTYFGKTKNSDIGKKYQFDYWYAHWRYGYKATDKIITN